ncbi:MAG: nuclear transport factor 2 family protein [Pyrinomonadaceae bacterium]
MSKLVYLCLGIALLAVQFGCGGRGATNANAANTANPANPNNPVNPGNPNDPNAPPPNVNGPGGETIAAPGKNGKPPLSSTNETVTQPPADSSGISFAAMDFHSALLHGNKDQLAVLIADEFKGTQADGSVQNKTQLLAGAKPSTMMFQANVNPPQVKGDSATVTGTITLMGDDPKTAASGQVLKFTDIWRKHGPKWLVVSTTISK